MRLRLTSLRERVRASLFFVPMLAVIGAIVFGLAALGVDRHLDPATDLPLGFTSTVDSARVVLSTIAGATMTFAGIAFSISLLTIQLALSQYSPRVVHTLFRDPFNKRVMALVVGTFTYCVVVLRSVRSPLEDGGDPIIPNLSVAIAVFLGITTILAIVAFINHSAHTMDISEILERVRIEAIDHIPDEWALAGTGRGGHDPEPTAEEPTHTVRFQRSGWVQQVDLDALLESAPDGSLVRLDTFAGRYAVEGTPLCALSPPPENRDQAERGLRSAVGLGSTRTMQQDVSYGLRQLADVALKALSPGINDPTTAQDAIFHSAAVLGELLRRDPPPRVRSGPRGTRVLLVEQPDHDYLIGMAFDEVRRAAAAQPAVCIYLLEALHLLTEALTADGLSDRTLRLRDQARLVVAGCEHAGLLPEDVEDVRAAHDDRFGPVELASAQG